MPIVTGSAIEVAESGVSSPVTADSVCVIRYGNGHVTFLKGEYLLECNGY